MHFSFVFDLFAFCCTESTTIHLTDLTDHDGKRKDANEVVDELEADLKDGGGVGQTSNGDQRLHGKVITANVAAGKKGNS